MHNVPFAAPQSVAELEEQLSAPSERTIASLAKLSGDLVILGVGGKMGPTLARLARRATDAAGVSRRIIGVSRFQTPGLREKLESWGIETCVADLLDEQAVSRLPDAPNVLYMTGFKFGATRNPALTWAMNCYTPALVCQRYATSRIVAFSTGNVYGPVPVASGGSVESDEPRPDGEYSMTALGRERMFQYFSEARGIPTALVRLNYATELRYGVLVDLALEVSAERPIDVSLGYVNVIWLGDANQMTLAAFEQVSTPARIMNLAGPDILYLPDVCRQFGEWLEKPVQCVGTPGTTALLNNGAAGYPLLGLPQVPIERMMSWTADWVARGGELLGKPTHFQVRNGKF
jgi:nucleoside-diphosphate-sugar epimerase